MHRYRKLPVIIEAFQITAVSRWSNNDWPEWLNYAWQKNPTEPGAVYPMSIHKMPGAHEPTASAELCVFTLEGVHRVDVGDWIIRGVAGELYPCKPDIFARTYAPVDEREFVQHEAGYHWRDRIFWRRHREDGTVVVTKWGGTEEGGVLNNVEWELVIPEAEWRSIICSVSAEGETAEQYSDAHIFHNTVRGVFAEARG